MTRSFVALAISLLIISVGSTASAVAVYECKPDFVFGRLWMRWLKVEEISANEVPSRSLTCVKPQVLGGHVCHKVTDSDQNEIRCNPNLNGTYAYGR